MTLSGGLDLPPGVYRGLLRATSAENAVGRLTVRRDGRVTVHLGRLGAIVLRYPT